MPGLPVGVGVLEGATTGVATGEGSDGKGGRAVGLARGSGDNVGTEPLQPATTIARQRSGPAPRFDPTCLSDRLRPSCCLPLNASMFVKDDPSPSK